MRKSGVILLTTLNIITTLVILFVLYIMFTLTRIADPVTYQGQSYFVLYGTVALLILIAIGIWFAFYKLVVDIDPRWYWICIILGVGLLVFSYYMPIFTLIAILYLIAGFLFYYDEKQ